MRILHVNRYGNPKGGADIYAIRACRAMDALPGTETAFFGNSPSVALDGMKTYDVPIPDFHAAASVKDQLDAARNVIWSSRSQRYLASAVDDFRPDLVHLHGYSHQFSSSILKQLKDQKIPTIATAHDYKLICPSYTAVRNKLDCFKCAQHLSFTPVTAKCLHDDQRWSAVALVEAAIVRSRNLVPSLCIAPSQFMEERLRDSWLSGLCPIRMLRNPADPSGIEWSGRGGFLLYVGRLSWEKGLPEIIGIAEKLGIDLKIAGDGPERSSLEGLVDKLGSRNQVEFLGHLGDLQLAAVRELCTAQVIPSTWPENAPLAASEAVVDGVPIIVSERGGTQELVNLGALGRVVAGFDSLEWKRAIDEIREESKSEGRLKLRSLRGLLSWKTHLEDLIDTYREVLS